MQVEESLLALLTQHTNAANETCRRSVQKQHTVLQPVSAYF